MIIYTNVLQNVIHDQDFDTFIPNINFNHQKKPIKYTG